MTDVQRAMCNVQRAGLCAAIAFLTVRAPAQTPAVSVRLVTPTDESYVSGVVTLRAVIEPRQRVRDVARVQFFADGQLVCNVMDPARAECTWDAGPEVKPHVIRVVAELVGGGRAVTSGRTRGLDIADKVTVEVVQITAVGTDNRRFVKGLLASAFFVRE